MTTDVTDPILGHLKFDEGLNWYEGTFNRTNHGSIQFTVSLDALPNAEAAIQGARELLPLVIDSLDAARAYACEELLLLKNDGWLQDHESPVSSADFVARLRLESLGVYADRECEIFFSDGDLFWGHTVLVSWSFLNGFYSANIAG